MTHTPPRALSPGRTNPPGGIHLHIDSYIAHCAAAGQAPRHVAQKKSHLCRFVRETRPRSLDAITLEPITANLASMRKRGMSARTCNWRRQIVVCFLNWCVSTGRLRSHNAATTPTYDESSDQRRVRRALTDDECDSLLAVAHAKGEARGLWYRLALEVGLRRGELAALRWADVDVEHRTLTVRGSKAKRVDCVPLLGDTAERLAAFRTPEDRPDCRVIFPAVTDAERREDFRDAGIPDTDARGRVADLHSLRMTLGTRLARRGVAPQIAQRIMRHRSYSTTLKHYTDLQLDDMRRALGGARPNAVPSGGGSLCRWLSDCPVPLNDPHRRAIAGLLSA